MLWKRWLPSIITATLGIHGRCTFLPKPSVLGIDSSHPFPSLITLEIVRFSSAWESVRRETAGSAGTENTRKNRNRGCPLVFTDIAMENVNIYIHKSTIFVLMSFFFLVKDEVDFPMGPIIYVCFSLESTNMNDISHGRCSWEGIWTPNICLKKTPSHDILGCLGPGRVETVWLFLLFLFFVQFFGKLRILKWTSKAPESRPFVRKGNVIFQPLISVAICGYVSCWVYVISGKVFSMVYDVLWAYEDDPSLF